MTKRKKLKVNNDLLTTVLGVAAGAALGYAGYKTGNYELIAAGLGAATQGYYTNKK